MHGHTLYMKFVRWDEPSQKLLPVKLSPSPTGEKLLPLNTITVGGGQGQLTSQGLKVAAKQKLAICGLAGINEKCSDFDFVEVVLSGADNDKLDDATMIYVNDAHPNPWPTASSVVHPAVLPAAAGRRRLVFSMRQHPEWSLGGTCTQLLFNIPSSDFTIQSIKALSCPQVIPVITLPGPASVSGFLTAAAGKPAEIKVSPQARGKSLLLEMSPCNGNFNKLYVTSPAKTSKLVRYAVDAPLIVDKQRVNAAPGIYQARVWIADAQGNPEGVSSDPFMLVVP